MSDIALCPDRQELERWRLGRLHQAEAASLEEHLFGCERCCLVLHELDLSDPLADTLRTVGARKPVIEDRVRAFMAHLKEVTLRGKATEETVARSTETTEDAWDLVKLLDPPEAEGELGRFGGYRVLRVLGAGGMGLVFDAEDPKLRRRVALKVMKRSLALHDEHHQRFLREARAAAAIEHPHIVTVYQVGEHNGLPFMAMQLLKGEALDDRLRREGSAFRVQGSDEGAGNRAQGTDNPKSKIENPKSGALPLPECLRIGRETAEALVEAHQRNLIHRDIKPGNIWLEGARGWVKLVDFGLAHAAEDIHLTQTGAILGTPAYMSPEQARGEAVDGRTDLYSLGAVLYKLTTGEVPFRGVNTMAVLMALATETPRPPRQINPNIPPALDDLIVRLLAKKPHERFESAAAVAEAIRAIEQESPKSEVQSPKLEVAGAERSDAPARRGPRWPLVAAVAAVAAAAFILAAIVIIVRDKDGKELARLKVDGGVSADVLTGDVAASKVDPALRDGGASRSHAVQTPPPLEEWLKGREVLTVAQDGSGQFKTIQAALHALKPHQVVKVLDKGPYREVLTFGDLPYDTGMISQQQATIETPLQNANGSDADNRHHLGPAEGFRLSGLNFVAPPRNRWEAGPIIECWRVSALVIEDCRFGWTAPHDGKAPYGAIAFYVEKGETNNSPIVLRNCVFDSAAVYFPALATFLVERSLFRDTIIGFEGPMRAARIRHNVFVHEQEQAVIDLKHICDITEVVEITNNTVQRGNFGVREGAAKHGVVIRNNITSRGVALDSESNKLRADILENWHIDHNSYPRVGSLPVAIGDVTQDPGFLSTRESDRDYLRISGDNSLATAGAGGDLPAYIGALPPGPAPKEGDWFTRLRERWLLSEDKAASTPGAKGQAVTASASDTRLRAPDADKPFVVVRQGSNERKEFKRFTEAIAVLSDGDAIEIHGNGPFSIPRVRLDNKGLSIRAAPGFRPALVAKDKLDYIAAWFEVHGGSITLEGCDFYSGDANWAFIGEGPQWQWRNCRFVAQGGLVSLPGPGQRLTVRDSLIWTIGSPDLQAIHCRSDAQIELVNNVVRTMNHGMIVHAANGGFKLTLARNTILLGGSVNVGVRTAWLSMPNLEANTEPLEVHADGNLFDLRLAVVNGAGGSLLVVPDAATTRAAIEQRTLRWQGRDNLYCGPQGPVVQVGNERIEGLAAWRKFWTTDETGSVAPTDVSFTWDSARALHLPDAIVWLRQMVERAKQSEAKHLPDLGPDWELIGPGKAYLRALAARGRPVPSAALRPEPAEEGPFVVVREGNPVGGHVTLRHAIDAAENGDAIEIRGEGPFDGCDMAGQERGRTLVIRAAPGYLPVLETLIRYQGELTLEGVHFAAIEGDSLTGRNLHILNCSFEENDKTRIAVEGHRDDANPPEIVNCWLPGGAALYLEAGTTASIRNSIVYRLDLARLNADQQRTPSFEVERSIIWNPGATVDGQRTTLSGFPDSLLTLKNTLLEGAVYPPMLNTIGPKSSHNLYRTGVSNLVEWLRLKHNGGEKGSITAPPLTFDPHQWRLLSGSPGYQAGPEGNDFGADVTRIAVTK